MRWFVNAAFLSLVACGGESQHHTGIDALLPDTGGGIDGLGDGCNYVEQRDATNDDVPPSPGTPEATGLTVTNKTTICGAFEHTHFDGSITVDVDGYTVNIASDADVLVRLRGAGAESLEFVGVDIYGGATFTNLVGKLTYYGDHAVARVHLPAGIYELEPFALNSQAITTTIGYGLEIEIDAIDTRCPAIASGGFPEAGDGGSSTGNNMVTIPTSGQPSLTAGADNPESSGITLSGVSKNRLSGSAADITAPDQYEDKDTFAFASGSANEVTVRLGWTGGSNLDLYLFEAGSAAPVGFAKSTATDAEIEAFALKPNSNYWLLVGAKPGAGLPAPYSATLCGTSY
jgi:hypothetical protein